MRTHACARSRKQKHNIARRAPGVTEQKRGDTNVKDAAVVKPKQAQKEKQWKERGERARRSESCVLHPHLAANLKRDCPFSIPVTQHQKREAVSMRLQKCSPSARRQRP